MTAAVSCQAAAAAAVAAAVPAVEVGRRTAVQR